MSGPAPSSPKLRASSTGVSPPEPLAPRRRLANGGARALAGSRALVTGAAKGGFSVFGDFKAFITRGNVIDLAVGIVMGAAFTAIVNSLVADLFTPVISLPGRVNLENIFAIIKYSDKGAPTDGDGNVSYTSYSTIKEAQDDGNITLNYGKFFQTIIYFLLVSLCMFLLVRMIQAIRRNEKPAPSDRTCPFCFKDINKKATRCPNCTSVVEAVVEEPVQGDGK